MHSIHFTILPPPAILKNEVECVRIAEYRGEEAVAIKVSPNGLPGMVFHQSRGHAALEQILTHSERQFERRFTQTVGLPPQVYLRVKRFNAALRAIKTRRFERLTDVAAALNFTDQSHFIRDFKAFSGMTPTSLAQKVDDFYHEQTGYSFV